MKPRIKIVPRNRATVMTDEEIQALMNFDGLVQSAGQLTLWAKFMGNMKLITGGLAVVSVSSLLVWVTQDSAMTPPENLPVAEQKIIPPEEKPIATDSAVSLKEAPVQQLPVVRIVPKKAAEGVSRQQVAQVAAQEPAQPTPPAAANYRQAEPVEGFTHLYEYLSRELTYPMEALQDSVKGVATVTFVIDRKGQVGKITVLNSLGPDFDNAIMKLINNMPAWKPATIDDRPVPSIFMLPLNFNVEQSKQ